MCLTLKVALQKSLFYHMFLSCVCDYVYTQCLCLVPTGACVVAGGDVDAAVARVIGTGHVPPPVAPVQPVTLPWTHRTLCAGGWSEPRKNSRKRRNEKRLRWRLNWRVVKVGQC